MFSRINQASTPETNSPTGEQGFSLAELVVGMFVLTEVLVVVLLLFDLNNKVSRVQTSVAEMQQSQRVAQHDLLRFVRMAGRGTLPRSVAVNVRNNVSGLGPENTIDGAVGIGPEIVGGTDVIIVRGVFSTPIYQLNTVDENSYIDGDEDNSDGVPNDTVQITVQAATAEGIPQSLEPLINLASGLRPEAIVLTSPINDSVYVVAELLGVTMDGTGTVATLSISKEITNSGLQGGYLTLSSTPGQWPAELDSAAFLGILEEYRYYIQEDYAITSDTSTELMPRLARAQFYPASNTPWANDPLNLDVEIAENIWDLQVAMAVDINDDRTIDEGDAATNEWVYDSGGVEPATNAWFTDAHRLYFLRITTLARSPDPDRGYVAPDVGAIEDHDYTDLFGLPSELGTAQTQAGVQSRRIRELETIIDMRNLG